MNPRNKKVGLGLHLKTWASIFIIVEIAFIALCLCWTAQADQLPLAPMHLKTSGASAKLTTQYDQIHEYIEQVFGKDSDKAFLLLQGTSSVSCHENRGLNPSAIHINDDGSKDVGVFQISEYWQGVPARFLLDYKVNVDVAHKIYVDSGYNFHLWTAGRCLGI